MRTLVCRHCGNQVRRNRRLKHLQQHYCGAKAYQSARKLNFERQKAIAHRFTLFLIIFDDINKPADYEYLDEYEYGICRV